METHDEVGAESEQAKGSDQAVEEKMPSLTESMLALGLLVVTAIGVWMLYGTMIRFMPMYIGRVLGK